MQTGRCSKSPTYMQPSLHVPPQRRRREPYRTIIESRSLSCLNGIPRNALFVLSVSHPACPCTGKRRVQVLDAAFSIRLYRRRLFSGCLLAILPFLEEDQQEQQECGSRHCHNGHHMGGGGIDTRFRTIDQGDILLIDRFS